MTTVTKVSLTARTRSLTFTISAAKVQTLTASTRTQTLTIPKLF